MSRGGRRHISDALRRVLSSLDNFFIKFQIRFSRVEHSICHIVGMDGLNDVKQKGNESATFDLDLDLWPWIFKVKLHLGNGRPDCHGTKGTGVDRMLWCETLRKWVNWTLRWLGYLWPWILKVKLYLGNGRPHCHGTKGTGVDRMPWCET